MSILFTPFKLGSLQIENRFVRSATYEAMATKNGEITESLLKIYEKLASGDIGLIISGYMNVHPNGRAYKYQTNIYSDDYLPGLLKLTKKVHDYGGQIIFQIAHAGMQTTKKVVNGELLAPTGGIRNPITLEKGKSATENQIEEIIESFKEGALRSIKAGADGVQLHAAHTYLLSQFLSPFFNKREDKWGGTAENNFRILREIIAKIKKDLPSEKLLLVKYNAEDHVENGLNPPLASKYAKWMMKLGVDGLEVSGGSGMFSYMNMCRGKVPAEELLEFLPSWKKPVAKSMFKKLIGKFGFEKPYNLDAAKHIRKEIGKFPLIIVGGMRKVGDMEAIISEKHADFISLSRPFIREPHLVKNIRNGEKQVKCISCNRCLAAISSNLPVSCYVKKFPLRDEGLKLREEII